MILQTNRSHYISTDVAFRAIGSDLSGMLASLGLVKVPFTGQVDWATVARPAAARTTQGYEVWRFNDALQATAPVYLRLGYGSGYSATDFGLTAAIGAGVTADGGLVAPKTDAINSRGYNLGPSSACVLYVSGDSSRLSLRWVDNYSNDKWLVLERMAGPDGLPGPDGAVMLTTHNEGGNAVAVAALRFSPAAAATYGGAGMAHSLPPGTSAAVGADVALAPVRTWVDRRETRPLHSVLAYFAADLTARNPVAVTCWDGRTRTYMPMPGALSYTTGTQSSVYLAYLWE